MAVSANKVVQCTQAALELKTHLITLIVLDAEPEKLVRGIIGRFTLFHHLLKARPTLRDSTFLAREGCADGLPIDLLSF